MLAIGVLRQWRMRYFVLDARAYQLYYYESEHDIKRRCERMTYRGVINCSEMSSSWRQSHTSVHDPIRHLESQKESLVALR